MELRQLSGSISTHHAKAVRGTPDDPTTRAEVMTKAVDLTSPILGTHRAKLLAEQVMRLDEIPAAGAVMGELIAA